MEEIHLGIDIGGTKLMIVATKDDPSTVEELQVIYERYPTGKSFKSQELIDNIKNFMNKHFPSSISVVSLGVAICGLLEGTTILVCELPLLDKWNLHKITEILPIPPAFQHRVKIMNDAEAALVEVHRRYISKQEDRNIAVVVSGTGIGTSFLIDGKKLTGVKGWAGSLGSAPVLLQSSDSKKPTTTTLDELAGGRALLAKISPTTPQELIAILTKYEQDSDLAKFNQHEQELIQIAKDSAMALGIGLSIILNVFNPSLIVLGGGIFNYPGYLSNTLKSAEEHTIVVADAFKTCQFEKYPNHNLLVAIGSLRSPFE